MQKTKLTIVLLSSLSISACASFDMDMLNPFSSSEEEPTTEQIKPVDNMQFQEVDVSQQQLNYMHKEWKQIQPNLIKLFTLEAEVKSLKSQIEQQNQELNKLKSSAMTPTAPEVEKPMTTSIPAGTYSVQLAAASSKRAAEQAWLSMQRKHSSFLKNYTPIFDQFNSNGRPFYRVKIGSYPDNTQALNLCRQFKSQGGSCLVKKN